MPEIPLVLVSILYGIGAVLMLLTSGLYHAYKTRENQTGILRKLDHASIFIMIAGTYTPLCFIYLTGGMRLGIIIAQWVLVLAGLILSIWFINAPRKLTTIIYLLMGWMVVIPIKQIFTALSVTSAVFLITGGIMYTVGAIVYMIKRPNPVPEFFGFHEIFHFLVLTGVVSHYFVVLAAIQLY